MKILICDKLDKLAIEELDKLGNCVDVSNEENKKQKIKEKIVDDEAVSYTHLTLPTISTE